MKFVSCPKCSYPNESKNTNCIKCHAPLVNAQPIVEHNDFLYPEDSFTISDIGMSIRNFFVIIRNFFVNILNNMFAPTQEELEEEAFVRQTYANMTDQELLGEKQKIQLDIMNLRRLEEESKSRGWFYATQSNFFVSMYMIGKDISRRNSTTSIKIYLESQLDYINDEIRNRIHH